MSNLMKNIENINLHDMYLAYVNSLNISNGEREILKISSTDSFERKFINNENFRNRIMNLSKVMKRNNKISKIVD